LILRNFENLSLQSENWSRIADTWTDVLPLNALEFG
jgi:hypothetical protein